MSVIIYGWFISSFVNKLHTKHIIMDFLSKLYFFKQLHHLALHLVHAKHLKSVTPYVTPEKLTSLVNTVFSLHLYCSSVQLFPRASPLGLLCFVPCGRPASILDPLRRPSRFTSSALHSLYDCDVHCLSLLQNYPLPPEPVPGMVRYGRRDLPAHYSLYYSLFGGCPDSAR